VHKTKKGVLETLFNYVQKYWTEWCGNARMPKARGKAIASFFAKAGKDCLGDAEWYEYNKVPVYQ